MSKSVHFFPDGGGDILFLDMPTALYYTRADYLLEQRKSFCTSQMNFLNDWRLQDYDELYIHERDQVIVFRNDHKGLWDCDWSHRELRYAYNLFKLWEGGEFQYKVR